MKNEGTFQICGFQPDYVIAVSQDFVYTYDKDARPSDTYVGQNTAWASSGRKGGYYSGLVTPSSTGFTFKPISSTENNQGANFVAVKNA